MKTKRIFTILAIFVVVMGLLTVSLAAAAPGGLDCEALANSPLAEPKGYAEECLSNVDVNPGSVESFDPTDTAFALDIGFVSDNFFSHVLNNFPVQTVVGPNAQPIFAMDFDETATTLYAIDNTSRQLGTINLASGAFTQIAVLSVIPAADNVSGLTIDPTTGTAYVSVINAVGMNLYTLDLGTAVGTFIGSDATVPLLIDISMNCDGVMYGHDIGTDQIYTIDTSTGAATSIGFTGVNSNFAQGMDFDNADGTLYAYTYQGGGANQYGTINLATGALTPLAIGTPQGEFEGATQTTCDQGDASIEISKTPATQDVLYGDNATFTITVTNTGILDLDNVTVSDPLVPACDNAIGTLAVSAAVSYGCTDVGVTTSYINIITVTSTLTNANPGPSAVASANITVLAPDINLNPTSLSSSQFANEVMTETFTIENTGNLVLNWTLDEAPANCNSPADVTWITTSLTSGSVAASASTSVDVAFDSSGLTPGLYSAKLCVDSDDPDEPQVEVDLTLTVEERPIIMLSTSTLSETLSQDEILITTLTISNSGDADLDWTIGEGVSVTEGGCGTPGDLPWVSVDPDNGSTTPGNSSEVNVLFNAIGQNIGQYSGELCITSNAPDSPEVTVSLNLTVVQAEFLIYMPSVHQADTTNASQPINVLPLMGLFVIPAIVFSWQRRRS